AVVPGLALQPNANGAGAVATVRGVNFDANVSGQNGTIEFYLNDTPISGTVLMQAMYDIGQLEVLRGPQGTLRGRASPSGSITVSLRKPNLSEVGGNAQATVNDLNGFNINGALNIPIIQDKLAVRVAGLVANDRGNRVRSWRAGDIKPRNDTESGRISVRADPFDGILLLDFTYQAMLRNTRQYEQVESIAGMPSNAPNPTIRARQRLGSGAMPFTTRQEIDNYTWQAQLSLFDQKLVYVGSSSKLNNLGTETADKAGIFGSQTFDGPIVVSGFRPAENFDLYPDRVTANGPISRMTRSIATSESHEVRLQNETRIFDMFDYVIGAMQYSFETPSYLLVPNLVGVVNTASTPKTANLLTIADGYSLRYGHAKEQSLFGNLTARPVEGLEISGGLRRIWYKGLTGLVSYNGSADGMDVLPYRNKIDEAATIYTGAIKYNVTPDLMVYASTGSSWRAPTAVIGGPIIPDANQARFLKLPAETSKSYEVGFKSDWLDRRLRLNVTAYHQKFKNYQYRMPGNGVFGFDRLRNAVIPFNYAAPVPVKVYGMEAELSYQILPNWSIGGLVTYTDGKISKGANLPCADVNGDGVADTTVPDRSVFLDGTVPYVGVCPATKSLRSSTASPWAASIQSEYAHRINDGMDAYLRGLFSWKGHSQNDPVNPHDSIKSYGLLNLYAGLRDVDGGWELSAYAKNLTNAYRVTSRTLFPLATALAAGTPGNYNYTNYYGIESTAPREFGINFRMAFGSR
ncbi:MAG: TonB-dependent receptor, partial [Novosphingobium sp.]